MKIRLGVIGSRNFTNYDLLYNTIVSHFDVNKIEYVVSGGCIGADLCGKKFAEQCKLNYKEFLPDWEKFGKSAGFKRNVDIISNASHVVAFWSGGSQGTRHSILLALKQKKPVLIIPF